MNILNIKRHYYDDYTHSQAIVINKATDNIIVQHHMLEIPYKENKKFVSCIPEGVYCAEKFVHEKWGTAAHLKFVPNRSEICIHPANWLNEISGCMAPGMTFVHGKNIKEAHVNHSRNALKAILSNLERIFLIHIFS